jgi:tetratricopeptide (TPR) repeat protein
MRRIRRALKQLVRDLPRGRSLNDVRLSAESGRIVVRDGVTAWNPESGQLQLEFRARRRSKTRQPEPRSAEAQLELGRRLYDQNEVLDAVEHYRKALALKKHNPQAAFNLGVALEDLGQTNEAIEAYRRAVEADPFLAEAHYNLSLLYQKAGKRADARRHLKTYKELTVGR